MTLSSTIEMKLRKREASTAPATAAGKVLRIQPRDPVGNARFANVVHWSYGTGWGGVRGALGALGLGGPTGGMAHFAAVWGSEVMMLPRLDVAPPLRTWEAKEIAIDVFHHAVYAMATTVAYLILEDDGRT
ncbi:hypothetical protein BH20ACT2_BH20ACT2_21550 [soil metagenome]